ncbi:MAG: ferrous iron transport protein A [Saccharofermentans sp.]|jgi:ferrous iron transport protein A|nr:ferrous iron transport protein A [Saccharofermentans sp.]
MKKLSEMSQGEEGVISSVNGDTRYVGRITSIGITPGCKVKVIKNDKNRPLIVYSRDTMIALNDKESSNIEVEEARG